MFSREIQIPNSFGEGGCQSDDVTEFGIDPLDFLEIAKDKYKIQGVRSGTGRGREPEIREPKLIQRLGKNSEIGA